MKRQFCITALLAALGVLRVVALGGERDHFETLLRQAHVIEPKFFLVHLSHACDLRVDGSVVSVIDVRQLINQGPSVAGKMRLSCGARHRV